MIVIVGLVSGIALIAVIVLVIAMRPAENMIDDELHTMITTKYPQFQALKD
jgi:hypothetical protein